MGDKKNDIEYFSKKPPFINRIAEKKYFLEYFNGAPTNILFVYGPKSTGKTTLIKRIIEQDLDKEKFAVSFLNMRDKLLINFKDFRNVFFPKDLKGKAKEIVSGIKINLGFFGWSVEDENLMSEDIFTLMYKKLVKANEAGIKPVIILDEFQYLKGLYIDDKKEVKLIEELFKFFISITKQHNLAHVVCLTSDSYYMEELYSDTKLGNTSKFYLIEHLSKKDIFEWLEKKEKIDHKIVKKIWENLGGSVWEIWQVLVSYKNTGDYKSELNDLIDTKYGLIVEWYQNLNEKLFDFKIKEEEKQEIKYKLEIFRNVIEKITEKGFFIRGKDGIATIELIRELVDKDIWFYDAKKSKITANSKSFEIVFARLLKELEKNS